MEEASKRNTVGEEALKLLQKEPVTHTAVDQMREQLDDYEANIHECIRKNKRKFLGDFYVVVITKKEKLMQNVLRHYFFARQSCPTPDYDQAVYRYIKSDDKLDFLWVLPAADAVNFMKNNPHSVSQDKYELLGYVLQFVDGSLLTLAKKLNMEKRDSNIIEKR